MLQNYFRIAWRNISRKKDFSIINIAGLAIGIAAGLILFTIVRYELSYEKFQPNYSRIYRIVTQDKFSDGITYNAGIPRPALDALRLDFPDVHFTALNTIAGSQVSIAETTGNKKFIEETGIYFCEPQFFSVFSYHWLSGNPATLGQPNSVVLSKSTAEKYFGNWQQSLGKLVILDNALTLKVNGIVQDTPDNTDIPLHVLVSFKTLKQNPGLYGYNEEWGSTSSNFQIYCLTPPSATMKTMNKALLTFSDGHYIKSKTGSVKNSFLQPLSELHFDTRFETFGDHVTAKSTLWTLSLIGIFIILMACINFINLSTAQAVNRSKELGVRKVLGGNRIQLFWQIMGETALIVLAAVGLALCIAAFTLPYISHIASIQQPLHLFTKQSLTALLLMAILVTLISGLYPSWVMSGFNPSLALKNKMASATFAGISLRRSLVVMQFAIAQVLIVGTIVAVNQMNFVRRADLGFNKNAVLMLSGNSDSASLVRQATFREQLLNIPGVKAVSLSNDPPSSDNTWSSNFAYDHRPDEKFQTTLKFADENYANTYGLTLIAGRNYGKSDTMNELLINEKMVHMLGIKDVNEVIDKPLRLGGNNWRPIVGVVKDFKANSLREEVKPMILLQAHQFYSRIGIRLATNNFSKALAAIEKLWNQYFPEYVYSAEFLDESIARFYRQDQQLALLYKIFAGLAIFISCLGLYGLISFMLVQKTKEVGIRKVLGASVRSIVYMFSKEFTLLIIIACLIAAPVAWYMMNSWLNDFAYRIHLNAGVFIASVCSSVVIAWLAVGYKTIRAAVTSPVKSLRSE